MEQHELLRQVRELSGKTQEDCAEHLDISVQQYGKYERGTADISNRNFFLICKHCRYYPILDLLEGINYFFVKKENANKGTGNLKTTTARIKIHKTIWIMIDKMSFLVTPLTLGIFEI